MGRPAEAVPDYEAMSREELVARLRILEAVVFSEDVDRTTRLVHDLEVHQIQLETQNRELRESQVLLEASRSRLSDLYDFAPFAYLTLDEQGRIVEANLTAAALFGIERGRLAGKMFTTIVGPHDQPVMRAHLRRCFHERIRVESQIGLAVRNRPPIIAHVASVPFLGPDGEVTGCKTTLTDITSFRRAQEKLQFLAQAASTLAASFDHRATLTEVARQAVPVLGDICIIDLVDAGGTRERLELAVANPARLAELQMLRRAPSRAEDRTAVGRAIRTKEALLFEELSAATLASTADGYEHEVLIRASGARSMTVAPMVSRDVVHGAITLIAAESGRRFGAAALATTRDLATHAALAIDSALLYERAQQAIAARETVLSFVSHDLRNPLMGVQLTTETLLRAAPGEERRKGWRQLLRIRHGTQQMRRMIDDLMDVTSLDSGRLAVTLAPQEARRLIDEALIVLTPLATENAVALDVDLPGEPLIVRCDRERIIQVLSNLLGNSLKFTPTGGSIRIAARRAGDRALLTVSDTGPGIPPAVRPHIFERFWQAEETARKGRGLGLYIAKGLVEAQGGAIWVDSPEGAGATFSFTLPLASPAEVDSFKATMETTRRSVGHSPTVPPE